MPKTKKSLLVLFFREELLPLITNRNGLSLRGAAGRWLVWVARISDDEHLMEDAAPAWVIRGAHAVIGAGCAGGVGSAWRRTGILTRRRGRRGLAGQMWGSVRKDPVRSEQMNNNA